MDTEKERKLENWPETIKKDAEFAEANASKKRWKRAIIEWGFVIAGAKEAIELAREKDEEQKTQTDAHKKLERQAEDICKEVEFAEDEVTGGKYLDAISRYEKAVFQIPMAIVRLRSLLKKIEG